MTDDYARELLDFRADKDRFFAEHPQSPLTLALRETFSGLRYYEPNPDLNLFLKPELLDDPPPVTLHTTTGESATYLRWATITFDVDDKSATLTLFRDPSTGRYFLPFQDANAGGETYGAGRYLEPTEHGQGIIHVDFNLAYNPFCAFSDAWSCPIPPPENRLTAPIRAGEMKFAN